MEERIGLIGRVRYGWIASGLNPYCNGRKNRILVLLCIQARGTVS